MKRVNRDDEHLAKLRKFYAENKIIPRLTVIGELTGMNVSSVYEMVNRLKKKGYLESYGKQLQPGAHFFDAVLLGNVQAGSPTHAEDNQPIEIDILGKLVKNPSKSALFTVSGPSMIDAGLFDGDYVVVQREAKAGVGDIVVAQLDHEYTVKYLAEDKNGFFLKAANETDTNFRGKEYRPTESLKIVGVVTGSFRSYNPRFLR